MARRRQARLPPPRRVPPLRPVVARFPARGRGAKRVPARAREGLGWHWQTGCVARAQPPPAAAAAAGCQGGCRRHAARVTRCNCCEPGRRGSALRRPAGCRALPCPCVRARALEPEVSVRAPAAAAGGRVRVVLQSGRFRRTKSFVNPGRQAESVLGSVLVSRNFGREGHFDVDRSLYQKNKC